MYDDILIATDGSEHTRGAVAHALGLAERYGATVHALYVVDSRALSFDDEGFEANGAVVAALEERGERATDAIAERAADRGLDATTDTVLGTPARAIRDYADEHGIDLIGLGTRGRGGLARYMLGSVAGAVVRKASQPVLTVNRTATPDGTAYDAVLLPTDGSALAERVTAHAFDIADRYDATVHALSVIDSSLVRAPGMLAALERESEAALAAATRRGDETDTDVVTRVWRGAPHDCITTYASERDIDLTVLGAHERRGLDRFLTESVAGRVVRAAPCPVITLRE